MRRALIPAALLLLGAGPGIDLTGDYRLDEGHEAAGALQIAANGTFAYVLAYGALDEEAHGRWVRNGAAICLTTKPKPVPPEFQRSPRLTTPEDGSPPPTLLVRLPDGHGLAGIDFTIGFDSGDPLDGYTQYYGWTMPEDEHRVPRWVEFTEPIHRVHSQRFDLTAADNGRLEIVLVPNAIGTVDFENACFEPDGARMVLHRAEGDMHFVREMR